ncbi:MAG: hypothetical protein HQ551_09900 [Desulfobacteraceae bacterium]|nr:hypothetical protein [Desulfobacteraceae bacterium]
MSSIGERNMHYSKSLGHLCLFFSLILALILCKLYLVEAQDLCVFNSSLDDRLFVELAKNIAEGRWLGVYDNRTLIKGPVYPLWIALIYKSGLPLLFSEHLLYIIACLFFISAIGPMVKRATHLLIVFCFLLFNPMTYTDWNMNMAFRAGINPALTLLVISITLKILIKKGSSVTQRFLWSITLGFFLSAFWLTREESIWILPFFAGILTFDGFQIFKNRHFFSVKLEAALWFTPFLVLFLAIMTVSMVNKIYYDNFTSVEIKTQPFRSAYGALLRVRQKPFKLAVPVSKETRQEIYAVSDAFLQLKPFLEGQIGKKFIGDLYKLKQLYEKGLVNERVSRMIHRLLEQDKSGIWRQIWQQSNPDNWDILGISFIWVFRDAIAAAGYHDDWATARNFYTRLAAQINVACEEGHLDCLSERSTLVPPWRNDYMLPLFKIFLYECYATAAFSNFDPWSRHCSDDPVALALFREVTGETPVRQAAGNIPQRNFRIRILERIGWVYQQIFPGMAGVMVLLYLFSTFKNMKNRCFCPFWCIATSIGMSLLMLMLGLSYIHITSVSTIETRYLAPAYPLVFIFCIFSWLGFRGYPWPSHHVIRSV